ncbi:hypothetical protein FACS189490_08030 [Clostridia bacterium]|nr:hypothetical protein FACS189490_08030 [Clostridia bacterium]
MPTAEDLDRRLGKAVTKRENALNDVAVLFARWEDEYEPQKYGLPFANGKLRSRQGVIVGEKNDLPLIMRNGAVYSVDSDDEVCLAHKIAAKEFFATADLDVAKTGFAYLSEVEAVIKALEKDGKRLESFIEHNKDGIKINKSSFSANDTLTQGSNWMINN